MPAWSIHSPTWNATVAKRLAHMLPETTTGDIHGVEGTPAARVADGITAIVEAMQAATGGDVRVFTHGSVAPDAPAFFTLTVIPHKAVSAGQRVELPPAPTVDTARRPCKGCPEK